MSPIIVTQKPKKPFAVIGQPGLSRGICVLLAA